MCEPICHCEFANEYNLQFEILSAPSPPINIEVVLACAKVII